MFFDEDGSIVTGLKDGRIMRLKGQAAPMMLADTHGRPLALARHPHDRRLIICDANRGLLALEANGALEVLSSELGGVPFRLVDDLAIAANGDIFFTDASARYSLDRFTEDLLEHQTTGRVLKYDYASRKTSLVANEFSFANGIALGPGDQFLVVAETGTYRLWRIWLSEGRFGQKELFTDALAGFPDNVRFSKERGVFWVALGSPRKPMIDGLAGWPALRGIITKLPSALRPGPDRHGMVAAVNLNGAVVEVLQHRAHDSYAPIASAIEHEGFLYLGSFSQEGLARVRLDR
jgi:sugar lactone lactonase YvrE